MKRKLVAFVLVFALLASLSPAVAADEMSAPPTVEEILNEYHQKAFEAKMQGDTGNASAWSLRGGQTLEEETVDALTEAGYEAYNVTADNYESLQTELKTDFSDMGLDPNGSYIIVISGEDPTEPASTGGASTYNLNPLPGEDQAPDGGPSGFNYTYNGQTYWMRFVTVIPTLDKPDMTVRKRYTVRSQFLVQNAITDITSLILVSSLDTIKDTVLDEVVPLGSIFSMVAEWGDNPNSVEIDPNDLEINSYSNWTCNTIQIWCDSHNRWETMQSSEYVDSYARLEYMVDDPVAGQPMYQESPWYTARNYSTDYFNDSQRYADAVNKYLTGPADHSAPDYDLAYFVRFYFADSDINMCYGAQGGALFTHIRNNFYVPQYSEE
jgi:hypothetical protein